MSNDAELLRLYATANNESAFRQVVERHLSWVYSVARRRVGGDSHLAEDVAQTVFAELARSAHTFASGAAVEGWLYQVTRFNAAKVVRTEYRRRAREAAVMVEQNIQAMNPDDSSYQPDWDSLYRELDEAMSELGEKDRIVLLLRFFRRQDFRAVGAAMNTSDDTAQKRVSRALEKLRAALVQRGVALSVAALAALLTHHAVATPPGLAERIVGHIGAAGPGTLSSVAPAKSVSTLSWVKAAVIGGTLLGGALLIRTSGRLPPQPAVPPPPPGLIAWWSGDGHARDLAGSHHAMSEGAVTYVPGVAGQAFHFNGVPGNRLLVPNNPSLNLSKEITVECWFRPDEDSNMGTLLAKRDEDPQFVRTGNLANYGLQLSPLDPPPQWGIVQYYNDVRVRGGYHLRERTDNLEFYTSRRNLLEQLAFFPTDKHDLSMLRGQWHYLVGTYKQLPNDQIVMATFLDGEAQARVTLPGSLTHTLNDTPLFIGGMATSWFKGCLDEIKIYECELTAGEIHQNFRAARKAIAQRGTPVPKVASR